MVGFLVTILHDIYSTRRGILLASATSTKSTIAGLTNQKRNTKLFRRKDLRRATRVRRQHMRMRAQALTCSECVPVVAFDFCALWRVRVALFAMGRPTCFCVGGAVPGPRRSVSTCARRAYAWCPSPVPSAHTHHRLVHCTARLHAMRTSTGLCGPRSHNQPESNQPVHRAPLAALSAAAQAHSA